MRSGPGKVAAAVLAGGKSSRFGSDKALFKLGGQTLVARTVAKVMKAGYGPVVVLGPPKDYGIPASVRVLPDKVQGLGPLGGLLTALETLKMPLLLVSCDMPFLSVALLAHLRRDYRAPAPVLGCQSPEGLQPLASIYHPVILPLLRSKISNKDLAVYPLLDLPGSATYHARARRSFFNLNRPADKSQLITKR